jgi:hypothetical protein
VVIRAGGSVEKLRVTANGGISFGASGTAYGVSGQLLQSNGNAAPTWISTGSLAAANATTATHLSGGVAGQIPYQTAPGVTAFLSTGTAGNVLVSNGSSAATYNNTLTLTGTTAATSTTTGALQVVGGVGVGGDLFIRGDILTNDTTFNLINANATTVNFAGAATTLAMGASGSGTTNVRNNLTVSGNLTVQGTTTIVDSTVTNIADPIITLGGGTGNSAPTADDNKDRGIAFKWVNNVGTTSTGFFGYDDSTGYLTYVPTATITNEVVSGTKGAMDVNLAGGSAMSIVYQSAADTTAFLAAGSSGFLLQTNGTGSAPTWVSASGVSAGSATNADNIRTIAQTANASHFLTFVDSNNATNAYESLYTTSSFSINPATGLVTISGASGDGVPILRVTGTSAPAAGFNWAGSFMNSSLTTSKNTVILIGQAESSKNSGYIGFNYAGTAGSDSSFMTIGMYANDNLLNITGAGYVGIGTTTPLTKLSVITASDVWHAQFGTSGGKQLRIGGSTTVGSVIGAYNTDNNSSPATLLLQRDGGSVGIGVSSTAGKLHVGGAGNALGGNIHLGDNTDTAAKWTYITAAHYNGATNATGVSLIGHYASATDNNINIGGNIYEAHPATNIQFYTFTATTHTLGGTLRLTITRNGGFAFGTSASSYGSSGQVLQSNGDAAPSWVSPSTLASASATNADNIRTVAQAGNASYYPTFVDSNNASNAYELVYTTGTIVLNPSYGSVGIGANPSIDSYGSTTTSIKLNLQHTPPQNTTVDDVLRLSSKFISASNTASAAIGSGPAIVFAGGIGDNQSRDRARIVAVYEGSNVSGLAFHTQTTADTLVEAMRITNNGRVGIGTTSTTEKFHIFGTASSGSTQGPRINLQYSGTSGAAESLLQFLDFRGVVNSSIGNNLLDDGVGTAAAAMVFKTATAGTLSERLRITRNGGISFGAGGTAYGTSGQILKSNGDAAPTWVDQSTIAAGSGTDSTKVAKAGDTMTGALTMSGAGIFLNRNGSATHGLSWYSSGYTAWADYMMSAGATGGPTANITAPSGAYVNSWALRRFIENSTGYGYTWESGSSSGQPSVVAELRSSDGLFHAYGNIYKYNSPSGGYMVPAISISDAAPTGTVNAGDLWWESDTGRLKIYYNDGSSSQWVDVVPVINTSLFFSKSGGAISGPVSINGALDVTGNINATAEITAYYSDRRLKTDVLTIENALVKVKKLNGVTYRPNELAKSFGLDTNSDVVGLFADEVEAVLPQAVKPAPFDIDETGNSKSGENYKTIQYEKVVPLLVEAIKEQQSIIEAQQAKIDRLMKHLGLEG